MTNNTRLTLLKLLHTFIWIIFNIIIFYLLWAALNNQLDKLFWIGIALVAAEGLTLLLFNKLCPLTIIARKYSESTKDNFDIYLPNWLARHTKLIYTCIMVAVIGIAIYQLIKKH